MCDGMPLLFRYFKYFAVFVMATVGAGAMRQPQFMAVRALGK